MKPIKVVFTGGPCAGKTTQISKIKQYLENEGYKVIIIPETATELINSGVNFKFINSLVEFQDIILKYQYFKEESYSNITSNKSGKIVLLYDRAILDNKTYFDNYRDFDYIMKNIPKSEIEIIDSYDLVLDLLSLATCKPEKYNLSSNTARTETVSEAARLDEKTSASWVGHKNLFIANSDISIEEEFEVLKDKINKTLKGQPEEKKSIKKINNTLYDFKNYNDNNSRIIDVESIILDLDRNGMYLEVMKRTYKGSTSLLLILQDDKNIYSTEQIDFNTYLELTNIYKIIDIEKYKSLSFVYNKKLFEIKFFNNKTILEYDEKAIGENFDFPKEIDFGKFKILK